MTISQNNYEQLIELAVLDAHDLLEPIESELFNRSFHDAPAAIQDEIIRLQYELATDETLLPVDMPPTALKQKVLRAVANAADQEAQRLAPLALIGARVSAGNGQHGSSKSITFWRTAAILFFGAAILFAIFALDAKRETNEITQFALNMNASNTLTNFTGAKLNNFIGNPFCRVTWLEPSQGNSSSRLRVAIHEQTGEGFVVGLDLDLEKGDEIILQGTTTDGTIIELARITDESPVVGREFSIDPTLVQGLTIAAVNAKTGATWI